MKNKKLAVITIVPESATYIAFVNGDTYKKEELLRAVESLGPLVQLAKDYAAILAVGDCRCLDGRLCFIHKMIWDTVAKAEGK